MLFFRVIASFFYGLGLRLRHFLFDVKVLGHAEFDIPVVCVGNITVGGTGKTPMIEYLVAMLDEKYTVAVLSRGYGRTTKGYMEVTGEESYRTVGDEPKQIKLKFPHTPVVVCESRREGIERLRAEHPEVGLILMDDGFQHRKVEPALNILLVDYTRPMWEDHLLPWGNLRDLRSQMPRAGIVVFTKMPEDTSQIDRRIAEKNLRLYPYQSLYFTSMKQGKPRPLFPDAPALLPLRKNIAVLAGVGNPAPLVAELGAGHNIVETFLFPDHHAYRVGDLHRVSERLKELPPDTVLITTEKDAVKLASRSKIPEELIRRLYVIPVKIVFASREDGEKFVRNIQRDIKNLS